MMICHCYAVSDRDVRKAVRSGACDLDDVADRCRAGSLCGGCRPAVAQVLVSCGISVSAVSVSTRDGARSAAASSAA